MNRSVAALRRAVVFVVVVLSMGVAPVESPVSALVSRRAGDTCLNEGRVVVTPSGNVRCTQTSNGLRWRATTAAVPESLTPKNEGETCLIEGRVVVTSSEVLLCTPTSGGLRWRGEAQGGTPSSPAPFGGATGTLKSGDVCLNEGRVVVGEVGNLRCTQTPNGLRWRPTTMSVPESMTPKTAGEECIIIGRVVTTGSEVLQCVRTANGSEWRGVRPRGDATGPRVISFVSSSSVVSSASAVFTITFSESVTGVEPADFSNSGTAKGCLFAVSGSGAVRTVTVSGCSEGTILPTFREDSVRDLSGNSGPSSSETSTTPVTRDATAPTVSLSRSGSGTLTVGQTAAVTFTVSETGTGFGASSVTVSGGSLVGFGGSGTSFTATFVPTPNSFGVASLQVAAGAFTDAAGNSNTVSGTVNISYDTAAPSVTTFVSTATTPTNASTVIYTLTFAESVTGITSGDFTNTGTATGCTFAVSGTGASYSVTVSGCTGDGTIIPRFAANGATDSVGNVGPTVAATSISTITRDTTPPGVIGFTSSAVTPSNASTVIYTLTFDESVTGITSGDFTNTGTATGCTFAVSGTGASYSVTVSGCTGDGTIIPRFGLGGAIDLASNTGPTSAATSTTTITRDTTVPTVTGFTSTASNPTNASTITYTITFSESVNGITSGDFANGGTATDCTFVVSGSGSTYTVTVSGCSAGTIIPRFDAGAATDLAGNTGPSSASTTTSTITRDTTAPTVTGFTSTQSTPTNASSFSFTLTFSESVTGVASGDFSFSGTATGCSFAPGSDSGATRTVVVSGCSAGTVTPIFAANGATDLAGNAGPSSAFTATATITRDSTAPTVTVFTSSAASPTNASTITYTITFSESVTDITSGDFTNAGTATGCTFAVSVSGSSYTVTVSGCTSDGTIIPQFAVNGATDEAGNTGPSSAAAATTTITRDTTAPTVTGFTSSAATPTNASLVSYTLTFSENVTGVDIGDFTNTGTAGVCTFAVLVSGSSYTVRVSGCANDGTIIPRFAVNGASDEAGNTGPSSAATSTTPVTRDTVLPTVTAFTSSEVSPTSSSSITYTITFSKSVNDVTSLDFANAGTAPGCNFAVSGSGSSYTVTVSGCTGDGTIRPRFAADGAVDTAGNIGPDMHSISTTELNYIRLLTVTFDANGGTGGSMTSQSSASPAPLTANGYTRTGYTFAGWNTAANGSGTPYADSASYPFTSSTTLYAQWTANTLTVTYDGNSGSAPSGGSSSTTTGATMSSLATSTRTGYTFAGWFTASSGGTQVTTSTGHGQTADFTLYARWTANTLTVTYDANGGTAPSGGSSSTITGGTLSSLATTTRASHTFNGWFTAASGGTQVTTSAGHGQTANFTLYAQWTADFCTTTCTLGEVGPGGGRVFYVNEAGFLCGAELTFVCKYLEYAPNTGTAAWADVEVQWTGTSGQSANLGVTAQGTKVGTGYRNTVVSVTRDGTTSKAGTLSRDYRGPNNLDDWYLPSTDELNELCKYARQQTTGDTSVACTGAGSYRAGTGLFRSFPNVYFSSTEVNAVQARVVRFDDGVVTSYMKSMTAWVRPIRAFPAVAAPSVTVTYDSQGGSSIGSASVVVGGQVDVSPGTPTRAGYTFRGWFVASSGGTAITFPYTHGQSSNFTLYAQWTANTLTVTTTEQGGSLIASASTTTGGSLADPGTPTRSGYSFNGWFEASSGGTAITFPWTHGKTADFTLYAQWTGDTLDITFDEQGGSSIADTTTTTGATLDDPGTPTRAGYTFRGWYTVPTGGTARTFPWTHGQIADFTLYAQWLCSETCVVGDTGPGGGLVFYVDPVGFACGPTLSETCNYLEAAPTGFGGGGLWLDDQSFYDWSGNINALTCMIPFGSVQCLNGGIGQGEKNTVDALSVNSDGGKAISAARAYRGPNNLTDWFLPSLGELVRLCKFAHGEDTTNLSAGCTGTGTPREGFSAWATESFWSSTEYPNGTQSYTLNGDTGSALVNKGSGRRIRPIRAF